jgi:hypothetical protein
MVAIQVEEALGRRQCKMCDTAIGRGELCLHIEMGTFKERASVNICMKCIRRLAIRHLEDRLRAKHGIEGEEGDGARGFNADASRFL